MPTVWTGIAGVPLGDLALLNFRGDIGAPAPATSAVSGGCSDLAWRRQRSFIAHNEDESVFFEGRGAVLTLLLNDLPPVTAFWKPGFVPSSTVTVTGDGLVWTIDHIQAAVPGTGAGRHIVARGLQRTARTAGQAVAYLREHPAAGGFAYTIGDRSGRVVSVEASAGQYDRQEVSPGCPLLWHTNHGRRVTGAGAAAGGSSMARGQVLESLRAPASEPDAAWFIRVLAEAPPPDGVRADPTGAEPAGAEPAATLCTFVADLTGGEATVLPRGGAPVTIPVDDLARGNAGAQRPGP